MRVRAYVCIAEKFGPTLKGRIGCSSVADVKNGCFGCCNRFCLFIRKLPETALKSSDNCNRRLLQINLFSHSWLLQLLALFSFKLQVASSFFSFFPFLKKTITI